MLGVGFALLFLLFWFLRVQRGGGVGVYGGVCLGAMGGRCVITLVKKLCVDLCKPVLKNVISQVICDITCDITFL